MVPAQFIVLVILRLYAVSWAFKGLGALIATVIAGDIAHFYSAAPIVTWWLSAVIAWFVAPKLSRLMIGNSEVALAAPNLKRQDLYAASLAGVGAYIALTNIAKTLNWVHYYVIIRNESISPSTEQAPGFYDFAQTGVTLVAGLAVFFWAGEIARKIDRSEKSDEIKEAES